MRSRSLAVLLQATMLFVMLLQSEAIHPKGYMVGDDEGWGLTIDMETWPRGKQFFAGDILGIIPYINLLSFIYMLKASLISRCFWLIWGFSYIDQINF